MKQLTDSPSCRPQNQVEKREPGQEEGEGGAGERERQVQRGGGGGAGRGGGGGGRLMLCQRGEDGKE